jgi:hypothetical protein
MIKMINKGMMESLVHILKHETIGKSLVICLKAFDKILEIGGDKD